MTANLLSERYKQEESYLRAALEKWTENIESLARSIDSSVYVAGRVKKLQSLLYKAYKKDPESPREWDSFGDIVALKAVFPTTVGAEDFSDLLTEHSEQNLISCDLDRRRPAPNALEYSADQFNLRDPSICDSTGNGIEVEVQVRTVANDAWYMVDHRLRYKNRTDLPDDLKRRVLRLIALAEIFDSEVSSLVKDVHAFESESIDGLYNDIQHVYNQFTNSYATRSRPENLLETLLEAYKDEEKLNLVPRIMDFVESQGEKIRSVMSRHTRGAEDYLEKYDWLYGEPEALLIADLARRPRMLYDRVANSDYEAIILNMASEFE